MVNTELSSYFNSYDRKSPARTEFVEKTGILEPGYPEDFLRQWVLQDGSPMYVRVNSENYPKLWNALVEECEFRNIEMPACYIDKGGRAFGFAVSTCYAFCVWDKVYDVFSQKELRALVAHETKHLYQKFPETDEESRLNEYDCDRAAVESTDYKTIQSYMHKAFILKGSEMMSDKRVPKSCQRLVFMFHRLFPNFMMEHWNSRVDEQHPSPAQRARAMREWERRLTEERNTLDQF